MSAKYIDLTLALSLDIPVWPGFGNAKFKPVIFDKAIPGYVALEIHLLSNSIVLLEFHITFPQINLEHNLILQRIEIPEYGIDKKCKWGFKT